MRITVAGHGISFLKLDYLKQIRHPFSVIKPTLNSPLINWRPYTDLKGAGAASDEALIWDLYWDLKSWSIYIRIAISSRIHINRVPGVCAINDVV